MKIDAAIFSKTGCPIYIEDLDMTLLYNISDPLIYFEYVDRVRVGDMTAEEIAEIEETAAAEGDGEAAVERTAKFAATMKKVIDDRAWLLGEIVLGWNSGNEFKPDEQWIVLSDGSKAVFSEENLMHLAKYGFFAQPAVTAWQKKMAGVQEVEAKNLSRSSDGKSDERVETGECISETTSNEDCNQL